MKDQEKHGFSSYLTDEQIKHYQEMPIEKRLENRKDLIQAARIWGMELRLRVKRGNGL